MVETNSVFTQLRSVLQEAYFLQFLKMSELDELIAHLRMIRVQKGYEIICQGNPGDAFYLIASGRVSVWTREGGKQKKIAELQTNDFFGEMALMSNEPRNATVIAEMVTELFVLQKNDFDKILLKNPNIALELKRVFQERTQSR